MAFGDYILCSKCECKLIYDGDREQRDWWWKRWAVEPQIECPDCKQPEQEPVAWMFTNQEGTEYCSERDSREGVWTPLYVSPNNIANSEAIPEQISEPEQEPVAWNVIDPLGKVVATDTNAVRGWARIGGYKPTVEALLGFHEHGWRVVPSSTPPRREWVGLTDEQISDLWDGHTVPVFGKTGINPIVFARAIEDKLREKNETTY